LAGLCLGLAPFFEYPTAVISGMIGLYALARLPRRLWPYLVAGALAGLATVPLYNFLAYHNPFTVPYTSGASVSFKWELNRGLAGFTWPPQWNALPGMSFSPYRGLFFVSPFLLLAFPGYALWTRRFRGRFSAEWLLCLAIPVVFFCTISMYFGWYGGWGVGPRYLVPMLPFVTLPIIFVLDRVSALALRIGIYGLMALSLVLVWIETICREYPPDGNPNPLFTYSLRELAHGRVALNLGTPFGFAHHGAASLIPLAVLVGLWTVRVFALASLRRTSGVSSTLVGVDTVRP
jgi:hypothetical protein